MPNVSKTNNNSVFKSNFFKAVTLILLFASTLAAQSDMLEPRRLIDMPTAGILPKAYYDFEMRIYPSSGWIDTSRSVDGSGVMLGIAVGITNRLNIGISYGGEGIVGRNEIAGNPLPGILVRYRLIEETFSLPGFTIGFDNQGYGGIVTNSGSGYLYRSPGVFLALSKNFLVLNAIQMGFHGSVTYSMEQGAETFWPSVFVGSDVGLNDEMAVSIEYDFALNVQDPDGESFSDPREGLLNLGLRWAFSNNLYIEFVGKDILENMHVGSVPVGWSRELKMVYVESF